MSNHKKDVAFLFQEAVENHSQGNLNRALELYKAVLDKDPGHFKAFHHLGLVFMTSGNYKKAVEFFHEALSLNQNFPEVLCDLGVVLKKDEDFQGAAVAFQRALALKPDFVQAHFNLGNLYRETGDSDQAIKAFETVITLDPNDHEAFNNLGATLLNMGRSNDAKHAFLKSLAIKPGQPSPSYNLGIIFLKEDNLIQAEKAFQAAIQADPTFSNAYLNMGNIMKIRGKLYEAILYFEKAIEVDTTSANGYYNLGLAFEIEKDLDREIQTQRQALKSCPDSVQTWIGSIRAFSKIAEWTTIDPLINKTAQYVFPESENALLSTALFMFHAHPMNDKDLFEKHTLWGKLLANNVNRLYSKNHFEFHGLRRDDRNIRIGYVSPDFCRHSMGWFFRQIALHHNPDNVEIYCYATAQQSDDLTQEIKNSVACFKHVHGRETLRLAKEVHEDKIQILVDLAGHTMNSRLDVFALRPSPVQVTMLGYPNGTGLNTIDYRITDHYAETESSKSACLEKHISLSQGFCPFYPLEFSRDIPTREDFGLPKDSKLMVSFNRAGKLRPEVLSLGQAYD